MTPENITVTQLANLLGVHPRTVKRWEKKGLIPPGHLAKNRLMFPVKNTMEAVFNNQLKITPGAIDLLKKIRAEQ